MRHSWISAGIPIALFLAVLVARIVSDGGNRLALTPIAYAVVSLYVLAMILAWVYHLGRYLFLSLIQVLTSLLLLLTADGPGTVKAVSVAFLGTGLLPWYYVYYVWFEARANRPAWSHDVAILFAMALGAIVLLFVPTFQAPPQAFTVAAFTLCVLALITLLILLWVVPVPPSATHAWLTLGALGLMVAGLWDERRVMLLYSGASAACFLTAILVATWTQAFLDELTQLPSRRLLNQHLSVLGETYCIAVLDIDLFKQINDRYGHDTGDQVLKCLAARLKAIAFGTAYRSGGEEFVILAPGRTQADLLPALDRFRADLAAYPFVPRDSTPAPRKRPEPITITASIGVAQRTPALSQPADVLKQADQALYQAKANGRNRVEAAR